MTVAVVNEEAYHGRNSGQTNQLLCGESLNTKKMSASCMKKKKKNLQIEQLLFWPTCQHSLYIPNTWLLQILQVHKCTKSML